MRKLALLLAAVLSSAPLASSASATALAPFIDLQEAGLTLVTDGEGLQGWDGTPRTLTVTVGGTVRFALLYWNGSAPCTETSPGSGVCPSPIEPFGDQAVLFDGNPITGTIIGTESAIGMSGSGLLHVGYFADVTSLVAAAGTGPLSFTFADGDPANDLAPLDGVGLLVAYTDAVDTAFYRVLIHDGLDFAAATAFNAGDNRTTTPVTMSHGAAAFGRDARLFIVAGGATSSLPDRVTVGNNPTLVDTLNASQGNLWDTDAHTITVPASAASTAVQVGSVASSTPSGCGPGFWKNHTGAWPPTGVSPSQRVDTVFSVPYGPLKTKTLLQTLQGGGRTGPIGAAQILLRSAVAAYLNAAHPDLDYARLVADVVADVNAALASGNRQTMLALSLQLDADNSLMCDFAAPATSDTILWQVAALRVPVDDVSNPGCPVNVIPGPPAQATFTVQDPASGLSSIVVTQSVNADTVVPPFSAGTTDPVSVSSTKIDQAQNATVEFSATDLAGNTATCGTTF